MKWIKVTHKLPPLNEWVILLDEDREKFPNEPPARVARRFVLYEEARKLCREDGFDPDAPHYSTAITPSHWIPMPDDPKDDK